jgi:hypothetical protein
MYGTHKEVMDAPHTTKSRNFDYYCTSPHASVQERSFTLGACATPSTSRHRQHRRRHRCVVGGTRHRRHTSPSPTARTTVVGGTRHRRHTSPSPTARTTVTDGTRHRHRRHGRTVVGGTCRRRRQHTSPSPATRTHRRLH